MTIEFIALITLAIIAIVVQPQVQYYKVLIFTVVIAYDYCPAFLVEL